MTRACRGLKVMGQANVVDPTSIKGIFSSSSLCSESLRKLLVDFHEFWKIGRLWNREELLEHQIMINFSLVSNVTASQISRKLRVGLVTESSCSQKLTEWLNVMCNLHQKCQR